MRQGREESLLEKNQQVEKNQLLAASISPSSASGGLPYRLECLAAVGDGVLRRAKTKTREQDGWRVSWGWLVLCSEKQRILGGAGRLAAVGDLEVE